ncbi:hypothetical protein NGRA_1266 [Nosema granulosis]|uniref:Uncharacterized protein n=1 Tax=Nosema granulosis TaxID=83296 RepID=A0A9P6GYR1_9MICR|nr:hypothetical protein NGRA_1266 [Nosema granulosis]
MEEDVTLASIKDMLQKYSSKKSLFTDGRILNKIEDTCNKIRQKVENKSPGLVSLLKKCSEDIRLHKIQNNKIEANECVECLIILNKIKKDIESIRKDNQSIKDKLWVCKIIFIPVVSLLVGLYLNKYLKLYLTKNVLMFSTPI